MLGAPAVIPVSAVLELYNPELDQLSAGELTGLGTDSFISQLAAFTFPASFKTEKQSILCYFIKTQIKRYIVECPETPLKNNLK